MPCCAKDWPAFSSVAGVCLIGCLMVLLCRVLPGAAETPDTCGDYFFLPLFPECDIFLETVPCFNTSAVVVITVSTPTGETLHTYTVSYGQKQEISVYEMMTERMVDAAIIRSTGDVSLYLHKLSGDSMTAFPIDVFGREYEIPNMAEHLRNPEREPSHVNITKSMLENLSYESSGKTPIISILYIFSPFNNTAITLTPIYDVNQLPTSPSTLVLDAFEIYKQFIRRDVRYLIHSKDIFAVVLRQPPVGITDNESSCTDVTLGLLDFVPPVFVTGKLYYIAFPRQYSFTIVVHGRQNSTVEILTDMSSKELSLGNQGYVITDVTKTSAAWLSTSWPSSVYVRLSICSNGTTKGAGAAPFKARTTPSPPATGSCYDNGFFLPSVEHYFTCRGNRTRESCLCICPSVFQRDIQSDVHRNAMNLSDAALFPLLIWDFEEISTSIVRAKGLNYTNDVIISTNDSFMMFRHDLDNLNFLPAGSTFGIVYRTCASRTHEVLFSSCQGVSSTTSSSASSSSSSSSAMPSTVSYSSDVEESYEDDDEYSSSPSANNQCQCDVIFDVNRDGQSAHSPNKDGHTGKSKSDKSSKNIRRNVGSGNIYWIADQADTARPLIAVIVSLSVAIFAVVALITGYMLVEMVSKRPPRNTKIRPFVS